MVREQVQILVASAREPGGEWVTLTEILPDRGVFTGLVTAAAGAPAAGDRILQVSAADQLTAVYHDQDDGTGQPADVRAQVEVRCDRDLDGQDGTQCGGDDCDDLQPLVNTGAPEFCDLRDNDCDGQTDQACLACAPAHEPDITAQPELLDPNPLVCGTCARGDFDEAQYADQEPYRIWSDVYRIEARAQQTLVSSLRREQPDGILQQILYDPASQKVAEDSALGLLYHTVEQDGIYLLALVLARVDHAAAPNAYTLELLCPGATMPDGGPEGGPSDGGPDGGVPDGSTGDSGDSGQHPGDGSGCGCRSSGPGAIPLPLTLALLLGLALRRSPGT
jgi:MYXO-CTERM domain-containing protein